jgi:hypothetical protein
MASSVVLFDFEFECGNCGFTWYEEHIFVEHVCISCRSEYIGYSYVGNEDVNGIFDIPLFEYNE